MHYYKIVNIDPEGFYIVNLFYKFKNTLKFRWRHIPMYC